MEAAVHKVISEFEANPMVCSRALRSLFERDERGFFPGILPLLRRGEDSPGFPGMPRPSLRGAKR